ncbi:hypothetical protein ZWY2020_024016 [Hordeum vulgare]|nr:hypothetical protein ZWY2020_024016 [Hordeum vulgare]
MRKVNGEEDKIDITSGAIDAEDEERPPGRDISKDERDGKRKSRETVYLLGEKLDTFIETEKTSRLERQKVIDSQHQLSSQHLETAKLAREIKLIELYHKLLFADASAMDDDAKVGRAKAMTSMRSIIFPE